MVCGVVVSGKVPSPQPGPSAPGSLADLISPVFMHQKGQVLILHQSWFSVPRPDRGEKGQGRTHRFGSVFALGSPEARFSL